MNTDPNTNLSDPFQLPNGMKHCTYKFGANPTSAFVPAPVGGDKGDSSNPRPEFKICWEDQQQGLKVLVQERENGNLIAEVFCNNPGLLDKAAVSVGLMGTKGDPPICKAIPLKGLETSGCSGSANFGPLANAVKELGPQLAVVVILLV